MKKDFFYNFLLTGSNLLFPLLTFPYVSRILGADGIGVVNFISSYSDNYLIIASLGIPIYGIREIAKTGDDRQRRSKLFIEILIIHLVFTLLLLFIYISTIFLHGELNQYKQLAFLGAFLILFNVFSITWLFAGVSDFKYITLRGLIIRTFSVIAIFIFVREKEDFVVYFLISVLTILLTSLVDIYSAKRFITFGVKITFKDISHHLKPILTLGVYTVLTSVYTALPETLLGFLSTKVSIGYYHAANRIIRMVITVFTALVTVMVPRLNSAAEDRQHKEFINLINKGLKVVVAFGIPLSLFIALQAKPIVLILAGEDFLNSVWVIQIMSPVIFLVSIAAIFVHLILSVYRKDRELVILSIIGMTISLTINLIFIPAFSEIATGFSQLIAEVIVTCVAFYFCKKTIEFEFPIKYFIANLIGAIPFILISYLSFYFLNNNFIILPVCAVLCGLYFLIFQFFLIKDSFAKVVMAPYLKYIGINKYLSANNQVKI